MQVTQILSEPPIRVPRSQVRFVQIYQQFCDRMTLMHEAGFKVPRTKEGQRRFCQEVQKQAYDCMMKYMNPYNQSVSAMLCLPIPDMIFARVDHVAADRFLMCVKPSTLDCWDTVAEQLRKTHVQHYGLTLSAALEIVELRMRSELPQHRPLNAFFEEETYED